MVFVSVSGESMTSMAIIHGKHVAGDTSVVENDDPDVVCFTELCR